MFCFSRKRYNEFIQHQNAVITVVQDTSLTGLGDERYMQSWTEYDIEKHMMDLKKFFSN